MADKNVTDYTQETVNTLDGSEQVIMFDTAEGKRATVAAVGEYVLKKLQTDLLGSKQTLADALSGLNSKMEIDNFTSKVSFTDSPAHVRFLRFGKLCLLMFQGSIQEKNVGDVLFSLPEGYRPLVQSFAPLVVNSLAFGYVVFNTNGEVKINNLSVESVTGRVYFNAWYSLI